MSGRDAARVRDLMSSLSNDGQFQLSENELAPMRALFAATRVGEQETFDCIQEQKRLNDYVVDPHSAIAITAAQRFEGGGAAMVALATAHPAKFPDVVTKATKEEVGQPARLVDQLKAVERVEAIDHNFELVKKYIAAHTRAGGAS